MLPISDLQNIVDAMRTMPQYRQYIEQRKLSLIDSNLDIVDDLLTQGVLK